MRRAAFTFVSLALVACGGSTTVDPAHGPACDRNARQGAVRMAYEPISGNCEPLTSQVEPNGSEAIGTACTPVSLDWSADNCTLTAKMDCGQWVTTSTTTASVDGTTLTGTATFDVTPPTACVGTYRVTATRP